MSITVKISFPYQKEIKKELRNDYKLARKRAMRKLANDNSVYFYNPMMTITVKISIPYQKEIKKGGLLGSYHSRLLAEPQNRCEAQELRNDYKLARKWAMRKLTYDSSVYFYNPTMTITVRISIPYQKEIKKVTSLRNALSLNTTLKKLFLSNTQLSTEGAIALAEYLPETKSLVHLDLTSNLGIDIAGVMALA
ncbi:hypothetical protein C2G38_2247785, partial [Gigaspora rosea]